MIVCSAKFTSSGDDFWNSCTYKDQHLMPQVSNFLSFPCSFYTCDCWTCKLKDKEAQDQKNDQSQFCWHIVGEFGQNCQFYTKLNRSPLIVTSIVNLSLFWTSIPIWSTYNITWTSVYGSSHTFRSNNEFDQSCAIVSENSVWCCQIRWHSNTNDLRLYFFFWLFTCWVFFLVLIVFVLHA